MVRLNYHYRMEEKDEFTKSIILRTKITYITLLHFIFKNDFTRNGILTTKITFKNGKEDDSLPANRAFQLKARQWFLKILETVSDCFLNQIKLEV